MITRNIETQVASSGPTSFQPTPLGQPDRGQAARHRAEGGDAVGLEVEAPADRDRADDGDEAARDHRDPLLEHDQRRDHRQRDRERRQRGVGDLLQRVPELDHRAADAGRGSTVGRGHAEHAGELPERHLDADAGEEADEHGAGDEVGEEAEPRDARQDQQAAGDQRGEARERQPLVRVGLQAGDAEAGDARVHDRRGGRVAADDEVARRAEQREGDRAAAGSCRGR